MFQGFRNKTEGYLTGQLLIAMPQLMDSRFEHAVLFMCGHDTQGAMGLVLNKPIENFTLSDLLTQLDLKRKQGVDNTPVYYGGPVEVGRGFVLHTPDVLPASSVEINDQFCLSATLEIIEAIAAGKGPEKYLIALGYAGWSPDQLEGELAKNSWLQGTAQEKLVFDENRDTLWQTALNDIGVDPQLLSNAQGNA